MTQTLVVGLDCAAPSLVFGRFRHAMPNLSKLMSRGQWGPLRSVAPPITVPAWLCMATGKDPGELGLYGFRNRQARSYDLRIATAQDVRAKCVWDYLGEEGKRVAVLFVPLTSPPPALHGHAISGFLWPGGDQPFAYPPSLAHELRARFGDYIADVEHFRVRERAELYADIVAMTKQHFAMARHILAEKRPDFMMTVEIGLDRFHHAFWQHIEPTHPHYDPAGPFRELGLEYYALLDRELGALLEVAGPDPTVLVVSDHGAKNMLGGFCINEWLITQGWLKLREPARSVTSLTSDMIDWSGTLAWAAGGYYGRVFLNLQHREPHGIVEPETAGRLRAAITDKLARLITPDGRPVKMRVDEPTAVYRTVRGFAPDLMVYADDLRLRAIGTVGHGAVFVESNDTGPDGCNHDWDGVFVMAGPNVPARGRVDDVQLLDMAKTMLGSMGSSATAQVLGRDWSRP